MCPAALELDPAATLTRNVLALTGGLLLWTAVHFGSLALLPLFLHDQGYGARSIGFMLGVGGIAQLGVRPFGGWLVDAFGRRRPSSSAWSCSPPPPPCSWSPPAAPCSRTAC